MVADLGLQGKTGEFVIPERASARTRNLAQQSRDSGFVLWPPRNDGVTLSRQTKHNKERAIELFGRS